MPTCLLQRRFAGIILKQGRKCHEAARIQLRGVRSSVSIHSRRARSKSALSFHLRRSQNISSVSGRAPSTGRWDGRKYADVHNNMKHMYLRIDYSFTQNNLLLTLAGGKCARGQHHEAPRGRNKTRECLRCCRGCSRCATKHFSATTEEDAPVLTHLHHPSRPLRPAANVKSMSGLPESRGGGVSGVMWGSAC